MRYRATVAYDGTAYNGYQRQPDTPTIQGTLEAALVRVFGQPTTVYGAGRTDTGVHATGQVIAFDAEWPHDDVKLLRAINANLPDDIALYDLVQHAGFHPRFDAVARRYRYDIVETAIRRPLLLRTSWQVYRNLDVAAMQEAANLLIGEHDFASFGKPPKGTNTIRRVLDSTWHIRANTTETPLPGMRWLSYHIEATAFLQHMVRRIVALLVQVGAGNQTLAAFKTLFQQATLAKSVPLAPPQGLYLVQVRYEPV